MLALSSVVAPAYMPAVQPMAAPRATVVKMETIDDLKEMSTKLNPVVGYWNPLSLGESSVGSEYDTTAAIGYLRHAEIKHGRVAMAAFVGFVVQSNFHWPWALTTSGITHADIAAAGGPAAQWDALPTPAKLQIFGLIFLLEVWGESKSNLAACGEKHYMRGGKPGFYPDFTPFTETVHPLPFKSLFDPFNLQAKMTPEQKSKSLLAEINNGRLAMIGIMGMASASKGLIVPGLDSIAGITPYAGEYMAPFAASDNLPFVSDMLAKVGTYGY